MSKKKTMIPLKEGIVITNKPVIKNQYNAKHFAIKKEVNTQPSKTVPNQAMTVKELIIRFANGLPLNIGKTPIYEGGEEMPDIDKMDLIERNNYYNELRSQRDEVEDRIKARKAKAQEMKMEKVIKERLQKQQEEQDRKEFEEFKKSKGGNNNG